MDRDKCLIVMVKGQVGKREWIWTTLSRGFTTQRNRNRKVANWHRESIVFKIEITTAYFYVNRYNPNERIKQNA